MTVSAAGLAALATLTALTAAAVASATTATTATTAATRAACAGTTRARSAGTGCAFGAMLTATVAVGGMALTMALAVVKTDRTLGTRKAGGAALAATVTTATATTAATAIAIGSTFATGGCLAIAGNRCAGGRGLAGERGLCGGLGGAAEEAFNPTEEARGLFRGLRVVAADRSRSSRGAGSGDRVGRTIFTTTAAVTTALITGIAGLALLAFTTATAAALVATTAIAAGFATSVAITGAAGVGGRIEHRDGAAAFGTEHRAIGIKRRVHGVNQRGFERTRGLRGAGVLLFRSLLLFGGGSGGLVTLVREGGRFPALGRALHVFRGEDFEFGLGGGDLRFGLGSGSGGFDDGRDGRDRSRGGGLCGLLNNAGNRGLDHGSRGGSGGGNLVRGSERVLVFGIGRQDLNRGRFVVAGCCVASGGRSGLSADAFAAREARAALGARRGTPIGGRRVLRTGGLGRVA